MTLQPTRLGSEGAEAMPPAKRFAARRGPAPAFTLVEILITLSLLALLASMAWPALQSQITASELPESAERVRSTLAMARCEAVMEHRRFRVRLAKGDQQPRIECEIDPINQPGVYVASTAAWAKEPMLLADVQIHDVQPGRPVYLQPLSITSDPDSARKLAEKVQQDKEEREKLRSGFEKKTDQEEEADPLRPEIVFEPDGTPNDWATLIVARMKPEETLEETDQQIWIVLDGRTGMATIREKVTTDQLSDPTFYVQREKLELPDVVNVDELTFDINNNGQPANEMNGGDTGQEGDTGQPDLNAQAGDAAAMAQQAQQAAEAAAGNAGAAPTAAAGELQASSGSTAEGQLEQALDNTSLTEEEKNNIRQGFPKKGK
ncbi:MAG TPA: prepilin-type N-terminal cleavage/methylation domain-containing protein [Phycisphaerae bacterium]|nr:prepilin-type N-terminal cleavage/methylation domain-containing protein [Phycisphaerae bacterium]